MTRIYTKRSKPLPQPTPLTQNFDVTEPYEDIDLFPDGYDIERLNIKTVMAYIHGKDAAPEPLHVLRLIVCDPASQPFTLSTRIEPEEREVLRNVFDKLTGSIVEDEFLGAHELVLPFDDGPELADSDEDGVDFASKVESDIEEGLQYRLELEYDNAVERMQEAESELAQYNRKRQRER